VDGNIHDQQQEYDRARTAALALRGLTVLRFTNDQVFQQISTILEEIARHLQAAKANTE
jgi:very-short-patch-repair endonuclease